MSARRVAWLLAAGVLVIAFAIWLSSQRHLERATQAGDLVLPGLEHSVNAVTQLSVRKGDGTAATIQRSGEAWSVGERGWPADLSKIRKLLLALGALNVVEEKTRLPANYPSLGVEDVTSPKATGTRVEASAPGRSWALIVGKSSNAKSGYVRVAGSPQSLLAAPLLSVDADPKFWLDHALADIATDRVRQVEEKPGQGPAYSVARDKKDAPHFSVSPLPRGRELVGPGSADGIPAALSALTLDDAHKAAGAADARLPRGVPHLRRPRGRGDGAQGRHPRADRAQRARQRQGRRGRGRHAQRAPGGLGIRRAGVQIHGDLHPARGAAEEAPGTAEEAVRRLEVKAAQDAVAGHCELKRAPARALRASPGTAAPAAGPPDR